MGRGRWPEDYTHTVHDRLVWLRALAREGTQHPLVLSWAAELQRRAGPRDRAGRAQLVLDAVHRVLVYRHDDCAECWQSADYTLRRREGDCEDWAVLAAALASLLDVPWKLRWLRQPGSAWDHVTLELQPGDTWEWAEPSIAGAQLGEHPYTAAARLNQRAVVR
jgi:transglutaminase-like putative cysteine protease